MHNRGQDYGEFLRCVDKKVCSDASEERDASFFRATEFVWCYLWND